MTTTTGFRFDRSYDNLAQVEEYLPAFLDVLAELTAAGTYRYNDAFRGRIPGIEGPDEDTAIYLLQGLERQRVQDAKLAALRASGYVDVDRLRPGAVVRYEHVVLFPTRRMGGEWAEHRQARVLADEGGRPLYVLPKGKRSHGFVISDRGVLVNP